MKKQEATAYDLDVFDHARLFTAATMRGRGNRARLEFADPLAAFDAVTEMTRTVVYAVDDRDRVIVLDRALWLFWRERWIKRVTDGENS